MQGAKTVGSKLSDFDREHAVVHRTTEGAKKAWFDFKQVDDNGDAPPPVVDTLYAHACHRPREKHFSIHTCHTYVYVADNDTLDVT